MRMLWLLLLAALAPAQQTSSDTLKAALDEAAAVQRFSEVALSPDGNRLAWVETAADGTSFIRAVNWRQAGATPRRIATANGSEHAPVWSPDGRSLAFLSDRESLGQDQIYVMAARGGAARKLTNLRGYLADPAWSPDGREIAFLYNPETAGTGGPLEATAVRTGVIDEKVSNQRLAAVEVSSGKVGFRTPAELHVYEYDWSPDSDALVFTAAPGPGDNNWYIARLYELENGRPRELLRPEYQIALPRWSPDGKSIAFIGGLMSDEGFTGGDVFVLPAAGGPARNLTPNQKVSTSSLRWLSPGRLAVTMLAGGGSAIGTLEVADGPLTTTWRGEENVHAGGNYPNFALAADGETSALIRESWSLPPDIWAGQNGRWRRITEANARFAPEWGQARSIEWRSDGLDVQGWLIYPRGFDPARRYPMILCPHGGPASTARASWPRAGFSPSLFAALGYFVFFPNPRGSYGQGEAFTRANVKDFGGGDLRDILRGVDRVLEIAPVDPNRIGITGWSYGGFMTMWAITQTRRFRAAVAGAGLANWQSYYGQNSIDQWMIPYFGASVYDDPAVYAKSSPINFVKNVRAPTLVVVGERDGECPAPQSFEFWHALKTLGVPTQLVVYPGEGHMFRDPEHERDVMRRAAEWFDRHLR